MPDFIVTMTGGSSALWTDTGNATTPDRLNPNPAHLHTYRRVDLGPDGGSVNITFEATVGGVLAPLDADLVLDGRLFTAQWAEWSGPYPPVLTTSAGQSSQVVATLSAGSHGVDRHEGHFLFCMIRQGGGSVSIHFDAVP